MLSRSATGVGLDVDESLTVSVRSCLRICIPAAVLWTKPARGKTNPQGPIGKARLESVASARVTKREVLPTPTIADSILRSSDFGDGWQRLRYGLSRSLGGRLSRNLSDNFLDPSSTSRKFRVARAPGRCTF